MRQADGNEGGKEYETKALMLVFEHIDVDDDGVDRMLVPQDG